MSRNKSGAGALAAFILAAATVFVSLSGGAEAPMPPPHAETEVPAPATPTPTPTRIEEPPTPTPTPPEAAPTEAAGAAPEMPPELTVAVGGDVLPLGRIGAKISAGEYDAVLDPATAERLREADVTMINLETSVSTRGTPIPDKEFTFRSPPENLVFLTEWLGADVVSVANNHTLDYGWDAFHDTMTHLDEYGIAHIGAGENVAQAAAPYVFEKDGIKIAFFAANQILNYTDWTAGTEKPGLLIAREPANLGALGDAMAQARGECDYIVVYMHWGKELDKEPHERQTATARALLDAGADVVIGSHPHVVQSFAYYGGKPIIYSVGNFLFNALNPDTVVIFLRFGSDGKVSVEAVPAHTSGTLTYALDPEGSRRLFDLWESISTGVAFGGDGIMSPA